MREHDHSADDATLNAFRHLRNPWRGWEVVDDGRAVRVQATDGVVVRLTTLGAEPEPGFAVRRLHAEFERGAVRPVALRGGFDVGFNDVVVLAGESWMVRLVRPLDDDAGAGPATPGALVTHGHPGARPAQADARCVTTDALLVASARGLTWLLRVASDGRLCVETEPAAVRDFLAARGHRAP